MFNQWSVSVVELFGQWQVKAFRNKSPGGINGFLDIQTVGAKVNDEPVLLSLLKKYVSIPAY